MLRITLKRQTNFQIVENVVFPEVTRPLIIFIKYMRWYKSESFFI